MDFSQLPQLANDIVTYAAPALPYLVQVGEKAFDSFKDTVGEKLGERGAKLLFDLWDKVGDKLASPEATMDPARKLAANPYDESAKQEFRDQVLVHLREDPDWAEEVSGIVVQCKKLNITVTVTGDKIAGDKVGGDKITVGGNQINVGGKAGDIAGGDIYKNIQFHFHSHPPAPSTGESIEPDLKISTGRLPRTEGELFGRKGEMARLDAAWEDQRTHVISLVAFGGVGKTALVKHWLAGMAAEGYRGAERVFEWSFYSQGTSNKQATAEVFIAEALKWFGDPDHAEGSPFDKGQRLADLVRGQRTLLVLDGLEPLQYQPEKGLTEGALKDPGLKMLLEGLAASNPGLCVVTSRERVRDIAHFTKTAPVVDLETLSGEAGEQILRNLGVDGPEEELRAASREFGGHGLALNLLGNYLVDYCDKDVRRRGEVHILDEDEEKGGHARRVMRSYEDHLGGAGRTWLCYASPACSTVPPTANWWRC